MHIPSFVITLGEEFNNVFVFATALYHWIFSSGLEKNVLKFTKRFIYVQEICLCTVATNVIQSTGGEHPQIAEKKNVFPVIKKIVLAIFYKNGLVLLVVNIEVKTLEQIVWFHSH